MLFKNRDLSNTSKAITTFITRKSEFMKTFFVLILISFKLIAFPIGNGKANFESNTKSTFFKEFQNTVNIASFDEELLETKESENDSAQIISEKLSFYLKDIFSSLLIHRNSLIKIFPLQLFSYQQLYRLYLNFRI